MSAIRISVLVVLSMLAFAANSLLCRAALLHSDIDAASFTTIRLLSGAITLWLLLALSGRASIRYGSWWGALALFVYAAAFSFAYNGLSTATGALLLFGAVQTTMVAYGIWHGERFTLLQSCGFILAISGLIALLLPGVEAPPVISALIMLSAGIAWGIYSIMGKGSKDPVASTAGNFIRASCFTAALSLLMLPSAAADSKGIVLALASGIAASGLGYALWYAVLPFLRSSNAAVVQLSVPLLAAIGGALLLQEALSIRLILISAAILGGIALVIINKKPVT